MMDLGEEFEPRMDADERGWSKELTRLHTDPGDR